MKGPTLLAIAVVACMAAQRAVTPGAGSLDNLQSAATRLTLEANNEPNQRLVGQITGHAETLSRAWLNAGKPELSLDFEKSIEGDTADLNKASGLKGEPGATVILRGVLDDLAVKVKFVTAGTLNAAAAFRSAIDVKVETLRGSQPVNGLWVRCNPARWGVTTAPQYVFNSATSPTTRQMPPGDFVMWVETADHKFLAQQPVQIGVAGKAQEDIRFAVP